MADHAEVIIDAMVVACAAIATGSGDSFTPAQVERFDRYTSERGPLPNIQIERANYRKFRGDIGGNWTCDLFVDVTLLVLSDETGTTPTDKQISIASSDVENAVIAMDYEALKANLAGIESTPMIKETEEDPDDGIIITFQFQYKLQFADLTNSIDPF